MNGIKNKLLLAGVIVFLVSGFQSVSGQNYQLVWADEFDGSTVDPSKWTYDLGTGCPNLCGWGNNEEQYYRAENARTDNGKLIIDIKNDGFAGSSYTSSRLKTKGLFDFTYGWVEAKIKLPPGKGMWSAFWLLYTNPTHGTWPTSGEIDIVEMVGHNPYTVYGTIHYGDPWPNNQHTGTPYTNGGVGFTNNFHTYAVEWDTNSISWYVDSVKYRTLTPNDIAPYLWSFDHDFHIILNTAVGGDWPGSPDASTVFPQTMEIDYVRVYQDFPIGVESVDSDASNLEVFPNPTQGGSATLKASDNLKESYEYLELIDGQGRVIHSQEVERAATEISLDLNSYPAGMYMVRLVGEQGTDVIRISHQ